MKTVITNGRIVTENAVLEDRELVIEDERIIDIRPAEGKKALEEVCMDAGGDYVLPGFIDIHSDMIEGLIQPRSTAIFDFELAILEAERHLLTCGVTTMYHSVSMFREGSWDAKEIRQAPQVRRLAALIRRRQGQPCRLHHKYHLRYEVDNLACYGQVLEMLEEGLVDLLSIMDHSPGQGQYRDLSIYRRHLPGAGKHYSMEEFEQLIRRELSKEKVSEPDLLRLVQAASEKGITVASHDDDTLERLERNVRLGVGISEFPITMEVASEAVKRGLYTVLGAPNVVLGGSHSGNLSAAEAVLKGAGSVLVSDYYPQSLLHAVFHLHEKLGLALPEAVKLATLNPARAAGIADDTGSIAVGKRADLLLVHENGAFPETEQVLVDGRSVYCCPSSERLKGLGSMGEKEE